LSQLSYKVSTEHVTSVICIATYDTSMYSSMRSDDVRLDRLWRHIYYCRCVWRHIRSSCCHHHQFVCWSSCFYRWWSA